MVEAIEHPDHETMARIAVVELMRAADVARREMVKALEALDLTLQQFNVLLILSRTGSQGLPTLEVAEQMIEQAPGITRLMNRLVTKKYIRRTTNPGDRREQLCVLTPKGLRLLETARPAIHKSFSRILKHLNTSERERLVELLGLVSNS